MWSLFPTLKSRAFQGVTTDWPLLGHLDHLMDLDEQLSLISALGQRPRACVPRSVSASVLLCSRRWTCSDNCLLSSESKGQFPQYKPQGWGLVPGCRRHSSDCWHLCPGPHSTEALSFQWNSEMQIPSQALHPVKGRGGAETISASSFPSPLRDV